MSRRRATTTGGKYGKIKACYKVHIVHRNRRARLVQGTAPPAPKPEPEPQGTIPRISRLLALAHHIQELLDTGQVKDLAEVARRGHITRARMTQIMNLLLLAPDIQEEILFLSPTRSGQNALTERTLRVVLCSPSFHEQRWRWRISRGPDPLAAAGKNSLTNAGSQRTVPGMGAADDPPGAYCVERDIAPISASQGDPMHHDVAARKRTWFT